VSRGEGRGAEAKHLQKTVRLRRGNRQGASVRMKQCKSPQIVANAYAGAPPPICYQGDLRDGNLAVVDRYIVNGAYRART
jgi:hypothetical protein